MENNNPQKKQRVYAYLRKSTEDNAEGETRKQKNSLDNQRRVVDEIAEKNNLRIVRYFKDSETGYKAYIRKDFNEMIKHFREQGKEGDIKGIVCSEHNRLARNFGDGGLILWFLQDGLIKNIYTHDKIFTDSASDQMMLAINFAMAKLSSDETSFRSKLTHHRIAGLGQPPSRHLPGYKYKGEEGARYWVVDHKNAEIVKDMFERLASGKYSVSEIYEYSRTKGLVSAKTWKPYSSEKPIRDLLQRKEYIGVFEYEGEEKTGEYPTFIEEELFYKAQEILSGTSHPKSKDTGEYAYSKGLIRCAVCGGPMSGSLAKGHVYYRCPNRNEPCKSNKSIRPGYLKESLIDKVVVEAFKKIQISKEKQKDLQLKMTDWFEDEKSGLRSELVILKGQLSRAEETFELRAQEYTEIKFLPKRKREEDWKIDLEGARKLRNSAHYKVKNLENIVRKQEEILESLPDKMIGLLTNIQEVGKRFEVASPSNKRSIMETLCANLLWDGKKLSWDWKKPYNILTNSDEKGNWLRILGIVRTEIITLLLQDIGNEELKLLVKNTLIKKVY